MDIHFDVIARISYSKTWDDSIDGYVTRYQWHGDPLAVVGISDEMVNEVLRIQRDDLTICLGDFSVRLITHNEAEGCYYAERVIEPTNENG